MEAKRSDKVLKAEKYEKILAKAEQYLESVFQHLRKQADTGEKRAVASF